MYAGSTVGRFEEIGKASFFCEVIEEAVYD